MRTACLVRCAYLAGAVALIAGCGRHTEPKATAPESADPIPHFVDHLRRNDIVLEADPELSNYWKVVEPPSEGPFDVVVSLRGFPPDTTASEMKHELMPISLAHLLNAPARLAMSYPGLQGRPGVKLEHPPDPLTLAVSKRLIRLFESYRGP